MTNLGPASAQVFTSTADTSSTDGETQFILSESDRIADVCDSFQGDLLSLIEENDRYRELNHALTKTIKKMKSEMKQKQADMDGDFMKKFVDLKLECSELMLKNQVLVQKLRRLDPDGTNPELEAEATGAAQNSALAMKTLLSEKTLECSKLEQEVVRLHTAHRDQLKQAVDQVREQSRKRVEDLQVRYNHQVAALKEDCVTIKNMIADNQRASNFGQEEKLAMQKELLALRQELEAKKKASAPVVVSAPVARVAASPSSPSSSSSGSASGSASQEDLTGLREILTGMQINTSGMSTTEMVNAAVSGVSARESALNAKAQQVEAQKAEMDKANKELDIKAVRLNGKIAAFNSSVVKWNRRQQELRDKKAKKPGGQDTENGS